MTPEGLKSHIDLLLHEVAPAAVTWFPRPDSGTIYIRCWNATAEKKIFDSLKQIGCRVYGVPDDSPSVDFKHVLQVSHLGTDKAQVAAVMSQLIPAGQVADGAEAWLRALEGGA